MKLSEAQRKWLTHLRDRGASRSGTVTGFFCRRNGLSEFLVVHRESGGLMPISDAELHWPAPTTFEHVTYDKEAREVITPAGLSALEEE